VKTGSPKVERYFERTADQFDSLYQESSWWQYRFNRLFRAGLYERVRLTLSELRGMRNFSVLDVGCGSGRNSILFAQAGADRVLGIDFSPRMIELAEQYSRTKSTIGQCEFLKADFTHYEFLETFDVAVALGVFDYVADPYPVLKKMITVANSKVIASFPGISPLRAPLRKLRYSLRNCPLYLYRAQELRALCDQVGFSDYALLPYASSGWLVVGRVRGRTG